MNSEGLHDDALAAADRADEHWRTMDVVQAMRYAEIAARIELDAVAAAIAEGRRKWAAILAVGAAAMFLRAGQTRPPRWFDATGSLTFDSVQKGKLAEMAKAGEAIGRMLDRWRASRPSDPVVVRDDLALLTPREHLVAMTLGAILPRLSPAMASRALTSPRQLTRNPTMGLPSRIAGHGPGPSITSLPGRSPNPTSEAR